MLHKYTGPQHSFDIIPATAYKHRIGKEIVVIDDCTTDMHMTSYTTSQAYNMKYCMSSFQCIYT